MHEAERWVEIASLVHNRRQPAPIILVGTKIDLPTRALKRDQLYAFAVERGIQYFECSALSNTGVKQLFTRAIDIAAV
jgi:GTPase SAR1 family protein